MSYDDKIISLEEERIKESIELAEEAIREARRLVAAGIILPEGLMERLEQIRDSLEDKLINFIEGDEDPEPSQ